MQMTRNRRTQIPQDSQVDLDDPETNFMATLKLPADLSGKAGLSAFAGTI